MNEQTFALQPAGRTSARPPVVEEALQSAERAYRGVLEDDPRHLRAFCGLAVIRHQRGAPDEAHTLLAKAAELAERGCDDQLVLGGAYRRIGDLPRARLHLEAAVAADGRHGDARLLLAGTALALGDPTAAEGHYRRVIAGDADNAEAHQGLGLALQAQGQFEAAISHHEQALKIRPRFGVARISLGDACRHLGHPEAAIAEYERAIAINPYLADGFINLGATLHGTGRREEAVRVFQRALIANPGLAEAHYNLGILYFELDQLLPAVTHFERAIELRPAFVEARNNLGNALQKQGRHRDAIRHYQEALARQPDFTGAWRNMGDAWRALKRYDDAVRCYREVLDRDPDDVATMNHLGGVLMITGEIAAASRIFEKALGLAPHNVGVQLNYANVKVFAEGDGRLAQLERVLANEQRLPAGGRVALHFALGKAYADLGDPGRSFHHLQVANRLERESITYDELATLRLFDRTRAAFSADVMRDRPGRGHASEAPVFIIGMPRSGTTLVEQILASHGDIRGAGEAAHLADLAAAFSRRRGGPYPEALTQLTDGDLNELGAAYLSLMKEAQGPARRVVDKMPSNFLLVGLIRLALPNARIIHVRRDPVDNCLSCFSLLFAEGQPFAYDLGELGRYYRGYLRLMEHWRSVLPEGLMIEIDYEDIVANVEDCARRLVAHCALPWDPGCLAFPDNRRPVSSASLVQVRQPIYSGSVGRWRLYGERLRPLLDALGHDQPERRTNETVAAPSLRDAAPARAATVAPLDQQVERAAVLARRLQERGDLATAERLFRFVLEHRPDDAAALMGLGELMACASRLDEAAALLERSVAIAPDVAEAHGSLGAVHASRGEPERAIACYQRALALAPDHPGVNYSHGMLLQTLGRNAEAIACLRRAVARRPEHLEAHFALGNLLYLGGDDAGAIACYVEVLQLDARHAETHNNLANVYLRQGHAERAIRHYGIAIGINPGYADCHGNLGNAYLQLNRLEESIAQNLRALELNPARFGSYNNLGVAYQALGRFAEATAAFEKALELVPDDAVIHLNLANMARFTPDDRRLPGLQRLVGELDRLDEDRQIATHFAMGKAMSDLGRHDDAFAHLTSGNALKRRQMGYDEAERLGMLERVCALFTPRFLTEHSGVGDSPEAPIFIVGMPRSGTTLLEQVLASHSQVFGAGELETFKDAIGVSGREVGNIVYPDLVERLSRRQLGEIGQRYAAHVRGLAPNATHVVDKMPLNFMFAGLIHLALPRAKIINIRRDPLDTCVSCYSLLFTGAQPFAYDLAELGRYYRAYERVMEHWHGVLPAGVLIDVRYEALVDDLEGEGRRVLDHCGLEWEEACLRFHDTRRTVRTASLMQVREPINRRSIGSWRRYAKHLGPLAEALGLDIAAELAKR